MSSADIGSSKKWKPRKGTFSCRECKRRKRRCEVQPGSSACDACMKRQLTCVSQAQGDEDKSRTEVIQRRVIRVESLVTQLVRARAGLTKHPNNDGAIGIPRQLSGCALKTFLSAVLPSPQSSQSILDRGGFTRMPGRTLGIGTEEVEEASKLPLPSAHPVHFARKLIQIALCLQQNNDASNDAKAYADVVTKHVTSHDSLVSSLEGLETLVLESTFHVNTNDVQKGQACIKRAIQVAQLLRLDAESAEDRAKLLWFRLVSGDRMLSLMLGLPCSVSSHGYPLPRIFPAMELECFHSTVACRIISRNLAMRRAKVPCYNDTEDINHSFSTAVQFIEPTWWQFRPLENVLDTELMMETAKLLTQIHHYFLLVLVHQPFLLSSLRGLIENHFLFFSHLASAAAARDLIQRFLVTRTFHNGPSYRGLDDKAFIATSTLVLAHWRGHELGRANILALQRPHDIAIIHQYIELMDRIASTHPSLGLLKSLVKTEDETARGVQHAVEPLAGPGMEVFVPYFSELLYATHSYGKGVF